MFGFKHKESDSHFITEKRNACQAVSFIIFCLAIIFLGFNSFGVVSDGQVAVPKFMGKYDKTTFQSAGFNLRNPFYSYVDVNIQERMFPFEVDEAMTNAPLTADRVKLSTVAHLPISINPTMAWKLFVRYGSMQNVEQTVIYNSMSESVRRAFSTFYWDIPKKEEQVEGQTYALISKSRQELAIKFKSDFMAIVVAKLIGADFTKEISDAINAEK